MNKTGIEWVKNPDGSQGYTWNPITGCLNGCEYCYARKLANGRLRNVYLANSNFPPAIEGTHLRAKACNDPFYPRFWEERCLADTVNLKTPKGVFVCDMGELFGDWIPLEWQEMIFRTIKRNPQHRFYLLTKQPQNLIKFSPFPSNAWVGVTATDEVMFAAAHFHLVNIEALVKYVSLEPLLKWDGRATEAMIHQATQAGVSWLIIGAQTKPLRLPELEAVRGIEAAAKREGIAVFLKNNLKPLFGASLCQEYPL